MPSIEEGNRLALIRAEEKQYHDQCYAEHILFQPGSWLHKPVQTVLELLSELPRLNDVQILDLGCGVGRNTIPMAEFVAKRCSSGQVVGVDLLESAITGLKVYSQQFGVEKVVRAEQSEIEHFRIGKGEYDLIVAVSTLEHLRSVDLLKEKLFDIADGIKPEGIVCLIMSSNIQEMLAATGEVRTPMFEINLQTQQLSAMFGAIFEGWEVIRRHVKPLSYHIERNNQPVLLSSDCLTFAARKKDNFEDREYLYMSIEFMIALFRENADEELAKPMNAYMKHNFVHLGIKTPLRRELMKAFLKDNPLQKEWIQVLWELPEREFQIAALDMLTLMKKKLTAEDLPMVESMITTKSWWDTVDAIAAHIAGEIFRKDEAARREYVERWNESDNMWLNRTAILHQLTYKAKTDEAMLFRCVLRHAESKEFFHQKAIGWALRTYAKVNPESVLAFVESHTLKPLSRREALKHF